MPPDPGDSPGWQVPGWESASTRAAPSRWRRFQRPSVIVSGPGRRAAEPAWSGGSLLRRPSCSRRATWAADRAAAPPPAGSSERLVRHFPCLHRIFIRDTNRRSRWISMVSPCGLQDIESRTTHDVVRDRSGQTTKGGTHEHPNPFGDRRDPGGAWRRRSQAPAETAAPLNGQRGDRPTETEKATRRSSHLRASSRRTDVRIRRRPAPGRDLEITTHETLTDLTWPARNNHSPEEG